MKSSTELLIFLESSIIKGDLKKLPTLRKAAKDYNVSTATAHHVYKELQSRDFLELDESSGKLKIKKDLKNSNNSEHSTTQEPTTSDDDKRNNISDVLASYKFTKKASLGAAVLSTDLIPYFSLNKIPKVTKNISQSFAVEYCFAPGLDELIGEITSHYNDIIKKSKPKSKEKPLQITHEHIMITSGCTEAIHLCLLDLITEVRENSEKSKRIAVITESPLFYGIIQMLHYLNIEIIEVKTHKNSGLDMEALKTELNEKKNSDLLIRAVITNPNFHNPLGFVMPDDKKQKLVNIVHEYNKEKGEKDHEKIYIIEDDVYSDLNFLADNRPLPIKAFDQEDECDPVVLTTSSCSKTLAPGFRTGWIIARNKEQVDRLSKIKFATSHSSPPYGQYELAYYMKGLNKLPIPKSYNEHLEKIRGILAENKWKFIEIIRGNKNDDKPTFPVGTQVSNTQGSYLLWVTLPEGYNSMTLYDDAKTEGISIAPGNIFTANESAFSNCFRLSFGMKWSENIKKALEELGKLAHGCGPEKRQK